MSGVHTFYTFSLRPCEYIAYLKKRNGGKMEEVRGEPGEKKKVEDREGKRQEEGE